MVAFTSEDVSPFRPSDCGNRFAAIRVYIGRLLVGLDRSPEHIWSDLEGALPGRYPVARFR